MFVSQVSSLLAIATEHPMIQAAAIIVATFILEDAATILAAIQAQDGSISISLAIASLYAGIVLGDAGLYGLGRLAKLVPWINRVVPSEPTERLGAWLRARTFKVVLISRFMPGVRLPAYTACGYLGAGFNSFILASMSATLIWTLVLFAISMRIGDVLAAHFGVWRWVGMVGALVCVLTASRLATRSWKNGAAIKVPASRRILEPPNTAADMSDF